MPSIKKLYIREPEITTVYGEPVVRKRRAVETMEGQHAEIRITIIDDQGNPVPLLPDDSGSLGSAWSSSSSSSTSSASGPGWIVATPNLYDISVKVRYREASLVDQAIYEGSGIIWEPSTGVVSSVIDDTITGEAGIYLADFGIFDSDGNLIYNNEVFVYNRKSAWGSNTKLGPPSVEDVRLSLRDNDPVDNLLLDYYDFDLAEIAHAAVRTVQFWNDALPQIAIGRFSTKNFPHRDVWLEGIQLFLFLIAEEHYRRNALAHSAGGTRIDDKNKFTQYRAAWQDRMSSFQQRVTTLKVALNASQGFSSTGFYYGIYGFGR